MNGGNRRSWAILVAVYATFALDVYSAFTSSPQTTELNASARADTLMKWVKIGALVSIAGGAVGSYFDRSIFPLAVTSAVAVAMFLVYDHAKKAGLQNGGQTTENYNWR